MELIKMKFYRYHDHATNSGVTIELEMWELLRKTPKGYWIIPVDYWMGDEYKEITKKWVPKYSRKRFAYPTEKEAKTSFIARKSRQIGYLESQLKRAKQAYAKAIGGEYDKPISVNTSVFRDFK